MYSNYTKEIADLKGAKKDLFIFASERIKIDEAQDIIDACESGDKDQLEQLGAPRGYENLPKTLMDAIVLSAFESGRTDVLSAITRVADDVVEGVAFESPVIKCVAWAVNTGVVDIHYLTRSTLEISGEEATLNLIRRHGDLLHRDDDTFDVACHKPAPEVAKRLYATGAVRVATLGLDGFDLSVDMIARAEPKARTGDVDEK